MMLIMTKKQETEITILSKILIMNNQERYRDDDDYVSRISSIYYQCLHEERDLEWFLSKVLKIKTNFFKLNKIKKLKYLQKLFKHLMKYQITTPEDKKHSPLTIYDIFPDIHKIGDSEIANVVEKLPEIFESVIQNELRKALREKDASPIPRRGKDSALEVADIEHFYLNIKGVAFSFAIVVKGYKSIRKNKFNWKDVSYQISKAHNRTQSDYVIFVSAVEPVDGVISEMRLEGAIRGNAYLIIFMTPLDLTKFLRWRKII